MFYSTIEPTPLFSGISNTGMSYFRRKAFWVAKQLLQLGMGDAFDDWLIDKIQLLRKGPVIASGIQRIEQVIQLNCYFSWHLFWTHHCVMFSTYH
jgi:Sorting nexin C terminal